MEPDGKMELLPSGAGHQPTFNEMLIEEVRRRPELYDQQHRVCTDNDERNLIWELIARNVDSSIAGEFAKKRWLQMRDRYRKELRQLLSARKQPKWPYFAKLTWLDPYLKDTKRESLSEMRNSIVAKMEDDNSSRQSPVADIKSFGTLLESFIAASPYKQLMSTSMRDKGEDVSTRSTSTLRGGESSASPEESILNFPFKNESRNELVDGSDVGSLREESIESTLARDTDATVRRGGSANGRPRNPPYLVRRGGGMKQRAGLTTGVPTMVSVSDGPSWWSGVLGRMTTNAVEHMEHDDEGEASEFGSSPSAPSLVPSSELLCPYREDTKPPTEPMQGEHEQSQEHDWMSDEDLLFARLFCVRLKKLDAKDRRTIRTKITEWIDEAEERMEYGEGA